ncbi:MAG: ABC transporter permease [Nitrospirae bacterium]|nr:ABC transporter permease [Candidatus Manganitrophaceae bacterium]
MRAIRAIAVNTFREAVRNKILYSLVFFALVMMLFSLVLDQATVGQRNKIIKDLGLGSINIFGVIIAIVVGINLVYKEIEKRTIYPILAKPVRRSQFLIGKYFGILLTLAVETLFMSAFLFLLVFFYEGVFDTHLPLALFMIFIELAVVSAVAIFFSSFSTPFLSGMFTFAIYVIGHLTTYLQEFGANSGSAILKALTTFFYYMLPNLERFNLKAEAVYQIPVESAKIYLSLLYAFLYIVMVLTLSVLSFERRDFK